MYIIKELQDMTKYCNFHQLRQHTEQEQDDTRAQANTFQLIDYAKNFVS